MEFDMLRQIMSEIDPREDQKGAVKKMKELVEVHQELIEVTEKIENLFSFVLSSLSVSEGAYNCNWYDGSPEFKRLVYIMIVRSQKSQRIVALKYIEVSLTTYKWIVDKAYSFYSVLTALYNL
ncbi:odorant receptor coreceptor-like [Chironomus tepperi]|uniref:odorant receptor coreceptor-like n=1 Tax=Chironomus tepperi TaxID=113505 RepID=UPI00391FC1B3